MAKVWFARRHGARWKIPGGMPAYDRPLQEIAFPLDLGRQRRLDARSAPILAAGSPLSPEEAERVFVSVDETDLQGALFPTYEVGWYDSPYSPAEVARRLSRSATAEAPSQKAA